MKETTDMKKKLAKAGEEQIVAAHEIIIPSTKRKGLEEEEGVLPLKKKKKTTRLISLCYDLLQEIFVRLPVKSLCRFKCISKSLHSMISSAYFIDLHMIGANTTREKFLLSIFTFQPHHQLKLYSCIAGLAPRLLFTMENLNIHRLCLLSKPCRGLNLLYNRRIPSSSPSNIYICNPVTCEFVELPKGNQCATLQSVGLGFHPHKKEYKVVRLFSNQIFEQRTQLRLSCEVYTLGRCYGWRPIGQIRYDVTDCPPVFLYSCLHWIIYNKFRVPSSQGEPGSQGILSFNIINESFGLVSLPPFSLDVHLPHRIQNQPHIGELDGCLFFSNYVRRGSTLEIWLMKNYEKRDWIKFCCLNLKDWSGLPAAMAGVIPLPIRAGRIILMNGERAALYDPLSENIIQDFFEIPEKKTNRFLSYFCGLYEESLVSIGKTHQEMLVSGEKNVILMRILSKLPLASICRFRPVCRTWQTLISSDHFIELHLQHTMKAKGSKTFLVLGPLLEHSSLIPLESVSLASATVEQKPMALVCSKPCHGLNLLSSACGTNFLVNPCLMERSYLPCDLLDEFITDIGYKMNHAACGQRIGLGYNPHKKEHVVMKISYMRRRFHIESYRINCSVWTSGAAYWRRISDPPFPVSFMPPAFVDGSLYWMSDGSLCSQPEAGAILAFDVIEEKFRVVHTPCMGSRGCRSTRQNTKAAFLVELGGYLSLVVSDERDDVMEIWMLKHGAWTREYNIAFHDIPNYSLTERFVVPIDIRKEDGMILLNTGLKLGYYDPVNKSIETIFSLDHQFGKFGSVFPLLSQESLVSPRVRCCKGVRI